MADMAQHVTCSEVVELVTEYFDGVLEPADATAFEQHLNFCDGCVTYVEQLRITVATVGRVGEEDVPDDAKAKLLSAFRGWRRR